MDFPYGGDPVYRVSFLDKNDAVPSPRVVKLAVSGYFQIIASKLLQNDDQQLSLFPKQKQIFKAQTMWIYIHNVFAQTELFSRMGRSEILKASSTHCSRQFCIHFHGSGEVTKVSAIDSEVGLCIVIHEVILTEVGHGGSRDRKGCWISKDDNPLVKTTIPPRFDLLTRHVLAY